MQFIEWVPTLMILFIIVAIPMYCIGIAVLKDRDKKLIAKIKKQVLKELED
jgi:hypothetical protein